MSTYQSLEDGLDEVPSSGLSETLFQFRSKEAPRFQGGRRLALSQAFLGCLWHQALELAGKSARPPKAAAVSCDVCANEC